MTTNLIRKRINKIMRKNSKFSKNEGLRIPLTAHQKRIIRIQTIYFILSNIEDLENL